MFLLQPSAFLVKTVVYALLPTHVLALLAGLDQFVMKVRLLVSVVLCYTTYIAMTAVTFYFLCLISITIFSLNETLYMSVYTSPIEKIQLRAARIFLGVGRLHPKVSLLYELNTLPLKWEGMKRCIEFWVKVMRI